MHRTILSRAVLESTSTCFDAKYRYDNDSIGDFEAGNTDIVQIDCVITSGNYGCVGWIALNFSRAVGDDDYSIESSPLTNVYFGKLATEDEKEREYSYSFSRMELYGLALECKDLGNYLYYIEESN